MIWGGGEEGLLGIRGLNVTPTHKAGQNQIVHVREGKRESEIEWESVWVGGEGATQEESWRKFMEYGVYEERRKRWSYRTARPIEG